LRKKLTLVLVTLLALFLLVGCSTQQEAAVQKEGQTSQNNTETLKIGIAKEPANLNPVLISGLYGESLAGNIFDTLVSFKENSAKASPALAESWEINKAGTEYTFYLRKAVNFHNGDKLTADDVKFTLEAIMNPENASPSKEFFEPVKMIEVIDDYTVKITLKNPYSPFMMALGNPTAGIIPKKVVEKIGMDEFDRNPIGTGPFKFAEWIPDDHIKLVKNKDYFLAESNLDEVIYRPIPKAEVMAAEIQAGGIDIASDLLPQDIKKLSQDSSLVVKTISGLSLKYVGFSAQIKPFSDVRFRKAVYYAVPIDDVVQGIFGDTGDRAYSWIPPSVFPDDNEYMKAHALKQNKEKAKELFAQLKAEGILKDGFEFSIYSPQDPYRKKVATAIATELKSYGLNAKVEALEWGTLLPLLKKGKAGIYIMGWGSVPDPDRWTYKIFHTGSAMNFSKYSNKLVDQALEQGRRLVGSDKRGAEYKKAMRKALVKDYIHIPLAFTNVTTVMNKNVEGFEPSPQGYFHLVTDKRNVTIK
jgi:peptide/nickel transport system substrate-binding protein